MNKNLVLMVKLHYIVMQGVDSSGCEVMNCM